MDFLPAIDLLGGKAVRLEQGDYGKATVYDDDPVRRAQLFEEAGAEWVHVVDLDGARTGMPTNTDVIRGILSATGLKVEVGGGVRTPEALAALMDAGATRVVLGTALVRDTAFVEHVLSAYGADALVAGIDAKAGEAAVEGWTEGSGVPAEELASKMADLGFVHLIYTDIARDGKRTGIDAQAYVEMARAFGHPVIASGGVASVADLEALVAVADSVEGVIAGRAVYEGTLSVEDGVAACGGTMTFSDAAARAVRPLSIEELED